MRDLRIPIGRPIPIRPAPIPASRMISVNRPDDLLVMRFELLNLAVTSTPGLAPTLTKTADPAYIIAHFPPQHVMEACSPDPPARAVWTP